MTKNEITVKKIIPISINISVLGSVFPFSFYSHNNSYFSFLYSLTEKDNFTSNSYFC